MLVKLLDIEGDPFYVRPGAVDVLRVNNADIVEIHVVDANDVWFLDGDIDEIAEDINASS